MSEVVVLVEEIKEMLRHIHNDLANVRRQQEITERKLEGFFYAFADYFHVDSMEIDKVINLDSDFYSELNESYSPVDKVDKQRWEEYLMKKKERMDLDKNNELI